MLLAFLLTICLALGITVGNLGMKKYSLELFFFLWGVWGWMFILLRQTLPLLLPAKSSLDHLN